MPTLSQGQSPIDWISKMKDGDLIKNGRVVDLSLVWIHQADVLVDTVKIKIAENIEAGRCQVIDAFGLVAAPKLGGYPCSLP